MPTELTARTNAQTIAGAEETKFVALENGNIAVIWSTDENTGAASGAGVDILIQIYDPLGNPIVEPVLAAPGSGNDYANNKNFSATAIGNKIVIAYESDAEFGTAIRATELQTDLDGDVEMLGTVVVAGPNFATPNSNPSVTYSEASGSEDGPDADDVYTVTYNQINGTQGIKLVQNVVELGGEGPVSAPTTLTTSIGTALDDLDIGTDSATLSDGAIVAVSSSASSALRFVVTDAEGNVVNYSTIVEGTNGPTYVEDQAVVTALKGDGFVVAWRATDANGNSRLLFRMYDNDGTLNGPLGEFGDAPASNTKSHPQITALPDGGFIATWVTEVAGSPNAIYARVFTETGAPSGAEVLVHSSYADLSNLDIEILPDGRVIIAWETDSLFSEDTHYRVFDTGTDLILGSHHEDDVLVALEEASSVHGDPGDVSEGGDDTLYAVGEGDSLYGGLGDDTLVSGEGADVMIGGEGFDIVSYAYSDEAVEVYLPGATQPAIVPPGEYGYADGDIFSGIEGLIGSQFDDVLAGRSEGGSYLNGFGGDDDMWVVGGGNTVFGGEGDDVIFDYLGYDGVQTQKDFFVGGAGRDTIYIGAGINDVSGGKDDDTFVIMSGEQDPKTGDVTYHTSQNVIVGGGGSDTVKFGDFGYDDGVVVDLHAGTVAREHGSDQLTSIENVIGTQEADIITGNDHDNVLNGKEGNDTLFGGGGDDELFGGDGADRILGDNSGDVIKGRSGDDFLFGNKGEDTVSGGDGKDRISGGDSKDVLFGGGGNDIITGGNNHDIIRGQSGNDDIKGNLGNDIIKGGSGDDLIRGNDGRDTILGGDDNDDLRGGSNDDTIFGGNGDDVLLGGTGNDVLSGGAGNDLLTGGDHADFFEFRTGDDLVTVTDFEDNSDVFRIEAALNGGLSNVGDFLAEFGSIVGGNAVLDFGNGDMLIVEDVNSLDRLENDIEFI